MAQQIINVSTPNDGQGDPLRSAMIKANAMFAELYENVVFQQPGKDLSSNDFTDLLLAKLESIQVGAEVNVQSDMLQENTEADDYVKNKEDFFFDRKLPQIETYSGSNVFTLPEGYIVNSVLLVRTPLFEGTGGEWMQTGNQLTITKTMNTGNRIQINFY